MKLTFDSIDWAIGLALLAGVCLLLLLGIALQRPRPVYLLASVVVFALGMLVAALIDLALQWPALEDFFRSGTHRRKAMRTFLPWSLGLVIGLGAVAIWLRVQRNARLRRLQAEDPTLHAATVAIEKLRG